MKKFKNVLVVDDDPVTHFVSEKIIRHLNAAENVLFSLNGKEALTYISAHYEDVAKCPDLILLDLDMPVMDGFEFISKFKQLPLKKDKIHLAVIATTSAYTRKIQSIKSIGLKYYVSKPLNVHKLKELCLNIWDKKSREFSVY